MRRISLALISILGAIFVSTPVNAEADGPDYFRVINVSSDDVLNIRAKASASSQKIGSIPANGDGIQNRGCEGGLTFAQWEAASEDERKAAAHKRWCQVSYKGVNGWVAGRYLGEGTAPTPTSAANPSYDCTKADSDAEDAICSNVHLATLDVELARLYRLAVNGINVSDDRRQNLKAMQRGWIKGRNDCWKSDLGLVPCITSSYAMRIDEIRTDFFDARQEDAKGISRGPYPYNCDGLDSTISAVQINANPSIFSLRWRENWITPVATPAGLGINYEAKTADGDYVFWTKGGDATLSTPFHDTALTCWREKIG